MSCLTRGYTVSCSTGVVVGGISDLLVSSAEDVSGFTQDTSSDDQDILNSYTGVTMTEASGTFYSIGFDDETAQWKETTNYDADRKYITGWTWTTDFSLSGLNQNKRNLIMSLAECRCGLVVISKLNSGSILVVNDKNPDKPKVKVRLSKADSDSGAKTTDFSGYQLTLTAELTEKPNHYTGSWSDIPKV